MWATVRFGASSSTTSLRTTRVSSRFDAWRTSAQIGAGVYLVLDAPRPDKRRIHPVVFEHRPIDGYSLEIPRDCRHGCERHALSSHGVELASETVVGLSSNTAMPPSPDSSLANPFEVETAPHQSPFAPPIAASASPIPGNEGAEAALNAPLVHDATHDEAAPSRQDLLQRAAELGPATWDNIVLPPTDPILGAKMQPRVRERRARFRKLVKVALSTCVAFCLVATAATALSSSTSAPAETSKSARKTAPATGVVPVERLEVANHTKAPSHVTAAARPVRALKKRR